MKAVNGECVDEQLDLLALGELSAGEEALLRRHLEACPACRDEAERRRKLAGDLRDYAGQDPLRAPHFARLSDTLTDEVARARFARGRRSLLKIAAGLLLAVGIGAIAASRVRERQGDVALRVIWQQEGVVARAGGANPYPLIQGRQLLTLERAAGVFHVVALDRETGARQWATPFAVLEPFEADASNLYVWTPVTDGLELVALDPASGRERWRCRRPAPLGSAAIPLLTRAAGGVSWAEGGTVFLADGETGTLRWSRTLAGRGGISLASAGGDRLYAATADEALALDAADGHTLWQRRHVIQDTLRPTGAMVVYDGGKGVCVALRYASLRGQLVCLDPANGTDRWRREIGVPLNLQVAPGHVVVRSSGLEVFDDRTGRRLWTANLSGCAPVTWTEGRLYVLGGKARPEVSLLDGHTGRRLGTQPLASSCTGLVIDGKRSYLSGNDGILYALQAGG